MSKLEADRKLSWCLPRSGFGDRKVLEEWRRRACYVPAFGCSGVFFRVSRMSVHTFIAGFSSWFGFC